MAWELDFPLEPLTASRERLRGLAGRRRIFRMATRGAGYRWMAMTKHGDRLIDQYQLPAVQRVDFMEESDLFGLFVNAVSTLECLAYGAHALGSIRRPDAFPFRTERELRATLELTASLFGAEFPDHSLTRALQGVSAGKSYRRLRLARDFMSHRAVIPRTLTITEQKRQGVMSWSLSPTGRGDEVELNPEYIGAIMRLTGAHAYRMACGLDDFTREYFLTRG